MRKWAISIMLLAIRYAGAGPFDAHAKDPTKDRCKRFRSKVRDIRFNSDRYMSWWMGHDAQGFKIARHGRSEHNASAEFALLTSVFHIDTSTEELLRTFLNTIKRSAPSGLEIVIAMPGALPDGIVTLLSAHGAVVYVIPPRLCGMKNNSIPNYEGGAVFCGKDETELPSNLFRYYFYEFFAVKYGSAAVVMVSDIGDSIAGHDLSAFSRQIIKSNALILLKPQKDRLPRGASKAAKPNSLKKILDACQRSEAINITSSDIVSPSTVLGTRDAITLWSHSMTMQIQDTLERLDAKALVGCLRPDAERLFVQHVLRSFRANRCLSVRVLMKQSVETEVPFAM